VKVVPGVSQERLFADFSQQTSLAVTCPFLPWRRRQRASGALSSSDGEV
jgi:hypothetical protein